MHFSARSREPRFYSTAAWRRLSTACLRRDPICTTPGCGQPSRHADHRIPRAEGGPDALWNLRGLCERCHNSRSRRGNAEPRAVGCYADGMPRNHQHWWNR